MLVDGCFPYVLMEPLGGREVDVGIQSVGSMMARARIQRTVVIADPLHEPILQRRRLEGVHEAEAVVVMFDAQFVDLVLVAFSRVAVGGVHEFVVGRVQAVLHGPLVVGVPVIVHGVAPPAVLAPFGDGHDGGALFFRQVAQEHEDQAVALLGGIAVHLAARRHLVAALGAQRGNAHAAAAAFVLPAVIGALHAVALYLAAGQRGAAVDTGIAKTVGLALGVTEQHELMTQHPHPHGCIGGKFLGTLGSVPEIDIHRLPPSRRASIRL